MTGLVLPDAVADPAGYVLAVANLREKRIAAAESYFPRPWRLGAGFFPGYGVVVDARGKQITKHFERESPAEHIAAEASPAHALAEVALWRGIAERHAAEFDDGGPCRQCEHVWPCADLLAVVTACQAYMGGTT